MYINKNVPKIGLLTEINNNILKGHSENVINHYNKYWGAKGYPYDYVVVWYDKESIDVRYTDAMLVRIENLKDYGININQVLPYSIKHYKRHNVSHKSRRCYKSHGGRLSLSSCINDKKAEYEEQETGYQIKGRRVNNIYDNEPPESAFDLEVRSRKGSWKDKKVRYQWLKKR